MPVFSWTGMQNFFYYSIHGFLSITIVARAVELRIYRLTTESSSWSSNSFQSYHTHHIFGVNFRKHLWRLTLPCQWFYDSDCRTWSTFLHRSWCHIKDFVPDFISLIMAKRIHYIGLFCFRNRQKFQRAKSGECGGWGMTILYSWIKHQAISEHLSKYPKNCMTWLYW